MEIRQIDFHVVYSHYDKDGHRSRSVVKVKGEELFYRGHPFGLYNDEKEHKWKLIDIQTGKLVASSKSRLRAMYKLNAISMAGFFNIVASEDYKKLIKELEDLKRETV